MKDVMAEYRVKRNSEQDRFLDYCRSVKQLSEKTVEAYGKDIAAFRAFCGREELDEREMTDKEARAYVSSLSRRGLSNATINRTISSLRNYYAFRVKYDGFRVNPFAEMKD